MSRFEFKLPDIGEGVTEGEIVGWLVHVGDSVSENQDMVEGMTDKATVTIGAPKPGKVVEVRGGEGDVVPVGSVLVVLDVDGEPGSRPRRMLTEEPRCCARPPPKGTQTSACRSGGCASGSTKTWRAPSIQPRISPMWTSAM